MKTMTYSDFRNQLSSVLDNVEANHEPIIITRQAKKAVVIMSLQAFHSYETTAYLMSSINNATRLNRSIEGLEKARKFIEE